MAKRSAKRSKSQPCDHVRCGRRAESCCEGHNFCSWHRAAWLYARSGVWINPRNK